MLQPLRIELAGQEVEQLRVGRPRPLDAEVVGRLDQPPAEMLLPRRGWPRPAPVSGLAGSVSQSARTDRESPGGRSPRGVGPKTAGQPAPSSGPRWWTSPRINRYGRACFSSSGRYGSGKFDSSGITSTGVGLVAGE